MGNKKKQQYLLIFAAMMAIIFLQLTQILIAAEQSSSTTAMTPSRIAYVNIQQVIANCEEGKREADNFQQWAEKKQTELQSIQKELKELQERLKVQADKLTEDARFELEDTIETKGTLFQRIQQDSQNEADKRQRRFTNTIYQKALPIIQKMAEEKGLDLVHFFDINRDAYIRPSMFITDEVIKAYNVAYPIENTGQPIKK